MGRLLAASTRGLFFSLLFTFPAWSATLGSWEPTNAGIGGQFGTLTATPPETSSSDIFIPFFGVGSVVTFNGRPLSEDTYISDVANSAARAQATADEFSIGVLTFNERNNTNSRFGPLAAGAAATTNYFLSPDLDLDDGFGGGDTVISAFLNISGSFPSANLGGNFIYVEVEVNGINAVALTITNDSRETQRIVTIFDSEGNLRDEVTFNDWPGTFLLPFAIPIAPSVGTIHVRMFGESLTEDLGVPNALDFISTATLGIDTPPGGGFVGLATGQAFVSDTVVPLPAGFILLGSGLAGLAVFSRRNNCAVRDSRTEGKAKKIPPVINGLTKQCPL